MLGGVHYKSSICVRNINKNQNFECHITVINIGNVKYADLFELYAFCDGTFEAVHAKCCFSIVHNPSGLAKCALGQYRPN